MEMRSYLIIAGILLCFSCKKAEDRVCFKKAGSEDLRVVATDMDIDTLYLYDGLHYSLVQGSETRVELKGGENLLSHIEVTFNNGRLTVSDENKCNFLRSYKNKIHAKIIVDTVSYIYYEGSEELKSIDTLYSNELRLIIRDGAGSTDLTLSNGYTSATVSHGFGDFTLRGKTTFAYLHCNSNSYCDTRSFRASNWLKIKSNTVGKMLVNANTNHLSAVVCTSGDVGYVGTPENITLKRYGKGELLNLNN